MNKPQAYTVKVPTKTHLRKFIYAKHGYPLKLNYQTNYGTIILCMLNREDFSIKMSQFKIDVRLAHMNDSIELTSPINTMHYKGYNMSSDAVIAVNRYFENEFAEELYRYCRDNIKDRNWRPGIHQAIHSFAEIYGIEVDIDISFEALKKCEWRYRKREEEKQMSRKKNSVTFVPPGAKPLQMGFPLNFVFG
jgi:hypothetical protein